MGTNSVERFIALLKKSPARAVFNPWWEIDEENDSGPGAPVIRREQLRAYLHQRLANATLAIIGEALGYRGGHFTGIAMTSERMLLGKKPEIVAAPSERRDLQGHAGTAVTDRRYRSLPVSNRDAPATRTFAPMASPSRQQQSCGARFCALG
jgi:hypothetical protein